MDKSKSKSLVTKYSHSFIPIRSGRIVKKKISSVSSISAARVQKHFQSFFQDQLRRACEKGNVIEVKRLLERYRISPNFKDVKGRTPLHFACSSGYEKIVELLIQSGANIDFKDLNNNSPLHLSVISNNYSCVALLLRAGANAHAKDKSGKTPLDIALSRIQYLIQNLNSLENSNVVIPEIQEVIKLLKYYIQVPRNLIRSQSDSFPLMKNPHKTFSSISISQLNYNLTNPNNSSSSTKIPTSPIPSINTDIESETDEIMTIKDNNPLNISSDTLKRSTVPNISKFSSPALSTSSSTSSMIINSPTLTDSPASQELLHSSSSKLTKVDDLEEICERLSQLNNDLTNNNTYSQDYSVQVSANNNLEELRNLLSNIKL